MTKIKINVTAEHIEQGIQGDSDACPIALAFNESGLVRCSVGYSSFSDDSKKYGDLPPEATLFIKHFDDGDDVEPFTFEADVHSREF